MNLTKTFAQLNINILCSVFILWHVSSSGSVVNMGSEEVREVSSESVVCYVLVV